MVYNGKKVCDHFTVMPDGAELYINSTGEESSRLIYDDERQTLLIGHYGKFDRDVFYKRVLCSTFDTCPFICDGRTCSCADPEIYTDEPFVLDLTEYPTEFNLKDE